MTSRTGCWAIPTPEERALLDAAVERAIAAIECAITDGIEAAMNEYNRDLVDG